MALRECPLISKLPRKLEGRNQVAYAVVTQRKLENFLRSRIEHTRRKFRLGNMVSRSGIFAGQNPFSIVRRWLKEASTREIHANAITLATSDSTGMPNARMVLLKDIEQNAFVFYTNYESTKAKEIESVQRAAFVLYWKSLGRQVRVRGTTERVEEALSDRYFDSRPLASRFAAMASCQSSEIASRKQVLDRVRSIAVRTGNHPERPRFWGGYRVFPLEVEFWRDRENRLHDRILWTRNSLEHKWRIVRLSP